MPHHRSFDPSRRQHRLPAADGAGCMAFGSTNQRLQRFPPTERRTLAAAHKGSRAETARHLRVSDAKPPLQNLTEAMGVLKCKASASDRRPPPLQKASSTGKPSARFPAVEGGLVPIACGADSVASALHLRLGATPRGPGQTIMTLRASRKKRNFSFCTKPELLTLR